MMIRRYLLSNGRICESTDEQSLIFVYVCSVKQ
jgi:hypothetical protein